MWVFGRITAMADRSAILSAMDTEELVRRVVDRYRPGHLEEQLDIFDRDIEFVPVRAALERVAYRGHDGIRRADRDLGASWSEGRVEILDLEVRGDSALVIGRLHHRGRVSGAWIDQPAAFTVSVRNGRVVRVAIHSSAEDAREQLGWLS